MIVVRYVHFFRAIITPLKYIIIINNVELRYEDMNKDFRELLKLMLWIF